MCPIINAQSADESVEFKSCEIPVQPEVKENKKVRKKERKQALDQETDKENDQEKKESLFFFFHDRFLGRERVFFLFNRHRFSLSWFSYFLFSFINSHL